MPRSTPNLTTTGRDNLASRGASVAKLNGQVYTPRALVDAVVARLPMHDGMRVLDPACGDGVWLRAVGARARALGVQNVHLEGWDLDERALENARRLGPEGATWTVRDGLDPWDAPFDLVVGNPPYVEAKRMAPAVKARVKRQAPTAAKGAFDLYAAFLECGVRLLRPQGRLAFIVPNRVLVTAACAPLRQWMLGRGAVSVWDLSHHDMFEGKAAVYPVVVEVIEGASGYRVHHADTVTTLRTSTVREGLGGMMPLPRAPEAMRLVAAALEAPGVVALGRRATIRWTVSFHRAGLRDAFVFDAPPGRPTARRFLGGGRYTGNREVSPGEIRWGGAWIDYDEARARAAHNALPPRQVFERPKLVVCQNARRARCAVDTEGFVLKDTFVAVLHPEDDVDLLRWWMTVLHSDVGHLLYETLFGGTRKGGGYLHYINRLLSAFPMPNPPEGGAWAVADRADVEVMVRRAYGLDDGLHRWCDAQDLPDF